MSPESAGVLLSLVAVLAFIASGFTLMIAGVSPGGRSWCGRLFLLGVFLAVAASFYK